MVSPGNADGPAGPGPATPQRPIAALLRERLRESAHPVLVDGERILPAATVWTAARAFVSRWRAAGMRPGDRVMVATGDDLLLAVAVVAGLTGSFPVALHPPAPADVLDRAADVTGAAVIVVSPADVSGLGAAARPAGLMVTPFTGSRDVTSLRPLPESLADAGDADSAGDAREAGVALLLQTSGSTAQPVWVALSQENVAAVLESHLAQLFGTARTDADARPAGVMASVLPWWHSFGLVLDLLLGLCAAQVVMRDRRAGADPDRLAALLAAAGRGAWLSAVPLTVHRFAAARRDAPAILSTLGGGIVGGAACDRPLAAVLSGTQLRMGYGLTEAAPGVMLGEPGEFTPGLLGQPVGCHVYVLDGELIVSGANVSVGTLDAGGRLVRRSRPEVATGDTVRIVQGRYVFTGRRSDAVKLPSGRWLALQDVEETVGSALGLACLAQDTGPTGLRLLVDGSPAAASMAGEWLRQSGVPWADHVGEVVAQPQSAWPRTLKGGWARRGVPSAERTVHGS